MAEHHHPHPVKTPYLTRGTLVLVALALVGGAAYLYRLLFGLEAATNLDNQWPWGIWIAIDVASGVALAAGGFTTAALADIFHKERYHAIVRPALLTAMLGYTFVVIGLLADLGRYYNVWHPMLPSMWQGDSVLFEVGICVMI
ncbi:MAG TPA: polysulfide reductase NrfD, partial [Thermoanaerobaculales bacterium]|nr:polysulfide reductase NrfD [Thermoanaerobaculales bacterium]